MDTSLGSLCNYAIPLPKTPFLIIQAPILCVDVGMYVCVGIFRAQALHPVPRGACTEHQDL